MGWQLAGLPTGKQLQNLNSKGAVETLVNWQSFQARWVALLWTVENTAGKLINDLLQSYLSYLGIVQDTFDPSSQIIEKLGSFSCTEKWPPDRCILN
jgi:hypothetical protein